ncbi:MAG: MYXO-CTERM sorting domain-containing protein [Polyangiaceae bacterium]|nr:MYXO-CTERM sorting domain-containing protein [Polyangiaceae bacterium]
MLIATGLAFQAGGPPDPPEKPTPTEQCAPDADDCRIDELKRAYVLAPMPKFLLEVARLEDKLGRRADALMDYLAYAKACESGGETGCVDVSQDVARLKPMVGLVNLRIMGNATSFEISAQQLDPKSIGPVVYLEPGVHDVRIAWADGEEMKQMLTVEAGKETTLELMSPNDRGQRVEPLYGIVAPPSTGCACEVAGEDSPANPPPLGLGAAALGAAAVVARRRRNRG